MVARVGLLRRFDLIAQSLRSLELGPLRGTQLLPLLLPTIAAAEKEASPERPRAAEPANERRETAAVPEKPTPPEPRETSPVPEKPTVAERTTAVPIPETTAAAETAR